MLFDITSIFLIQAWLARDALSDQIMKFYFNTFLMIILDWSFNLLIQCLFSRPWELCSLFKMWEININPDYLESGLKSPYSFIFKVVIWKKNFDIFSLHCNSRIIRNPLKLTNSDKHIFRPREGGGIKLTLITISKIILLNGFIISLCWL